MRRNVAVILAGGTGKRFGQTKPKQFYEVAGRTVVEHTIDAFDRNEHIDEIAIVANPALIGDFEDIVGRNSWQKVKTILKGGKERYDSSLAAIRAYENADVNLIFHDAVRPLVSQRIINDVAQALESHSAIGTAIPSTDTIIQVSGDYISHIPPRASLRRAQTPQAFSIETIHAAYEKALRDPTFQATDDCGVVLAYLPNTPIFVVNGDEQNIKLTYKDDLLTLERLLK